MKSIPQMAQQLDISTGTIREYLKSFDDFFADPVEHEGVKEYPNETEELIKEIYDYYQTSGLTKEEIRIKLRQKEEAQANPGAAQVAVAAPMDMEKFDLLNEKIDKLTAAIESLTAVFSGSQPAVPEDIVKKD